MLSLVGVVCLTHWAIADGTEAEILNVLDDHSRLRLASGPNPNPRPARPKAVAARLTEFVAR